MASHVRCSVGEKLDDMCFQTTYVKQNFVIKAMEESEDVVRTIKYRVNMTEIPLFVIIILLFIINILTIIWIK
jgi:hypothetical protein